MKTISTTPDVKNPETRPPLPAERRNLANIWRSRKMEKPYPERRRKVGGGLAAGVALVALLVAVEEEAVEIPEDRTSVVVEEGDTLWGIANKELVTSEVGRNGIDIRRVVDVIGEENGIDDPGGLNPGKKISIPDFADKNPPGGAAPQEQD